MAEREASGDFDYLLGDQTQADVWTADDALPEPAPSEGLGYAPRDEHADDPDDGFGATGPDATRDGSVDAFDTNTWYFEPVPLPWYRTKQAVTAMIAAAAAAAALVVSAVLLAFSGPSTTVDETISVTPTAPTTVASSGSATTPAPPPPPPPPQTSAEPVAPPVETYERRAPRTTKEPEIGVTRTPVTRSQLSVAPQRPGIRN